MFFEVKYIDLPGHFGSIQVETPSETDVSFVSNRMDKAVDADSIFVIQTENRRYHVVAAGLQISENELDIFDSPFM